MTRRLTDEQRGYADQAAPLIPVIIATFLARHPNDRDIAMRADLEGAANLAASIAALTYDPSKAGISAYFTVAIQRELVRAIAARRRHERRQRPVGWALPEKPTRGANAERMMGRATAALQSLNPYDKQLIEDYFIEGVTLDRLGREQALHAHSIKKRLNKAVDRLRRAEQNLP